MARSLVLDGLQGGITTRPTTWLRWARTTLRDAADFYVDLQARRLLVVTSVLLTYGGGVAMFWLHAIYRGEQGPAISNVSHWFLDSTLGFVALTPVIFFLIASAGRLTRAADRPGYRRVVFYAVLLGTSFALVTAPGPALHNLVAGEGRPLANWATDLFGRDAAVAARALTSEPRSHVTEGLLQVAVGFPVYIAISWLAAHLAVATRVLNHSR